MISRWPGGTFFGGAGGNGQPGLGSGAYVASGTLNLDASIISANAATAGNGGFGGSVQNFSAGAGGAGGNGGVGFGGGVYVASGTFMLTRSTTSGNTATGGGGGVGGGAFSTGFPTRDFFGGTGGSGQTGAGGGVYFALGTADLRTSNVSNNTAAGSNGGHGGFGSNCTSGGSPALCDAPGGNGGSSQGRGMFIASGSINLANSTFFNNTTTRGGAGGIPPTESPPSHGTPFGGDSAGGCLFVSGGSLNLAGVTIASNVAKPGGAGAPQGSSLGGGIANAGASALRLKVTLVGDNSQDASSSGGGPDVSGAVTLSSSLISQAAGAAITNLGGKYPRPKSPIGS